MNDKHYNIVIAAVGDAEAIAEAEAASFSDPWSVGAVTSEITGENSAVLCAKDAKGCLVAYVMGSFAADEGELFRIAVLKSHRRCGLGKALLSRFKAELLSHGVQKVFLEVRASNAAAVALYESEGFKRYAVRRNYYKNPTEDALMMHLDSTND